MNEAANDADPCGLAALERALARDLQLLNHPPAAWVAPREGGDGERIDDVVIVGGGMCGLSAAFALARQGIDRVRILDARDEGAEGPWLSYARMRTLRSPKHLTGPAMGLPALTLRAWFEAQWGAAAWDALDRIAREQWMDYLRWYRRVLAIPVENGVNVTRVRPVERGFALDLADGATLRARKVVMATGREGMARPRIPPLFAAYMGSLCHHSADDIDFAALAGKRVVVIGLGASAFDNAGCALEAGAAEVRVLARAPAMPRINKAKSFGYAGFTHGFPSLPPQQRLAILDYVARCRVAPPRSALLRVAGFDNFAISLASPVEGVTPAAGGLALQTPRGTVHADRVILGTGFRMDLDAAPELAALSAQLMRWRDLPQFQDLADADQEYLDYPYLGPAFGCQPRRPGEAPWAGDLHCFNLAAQISHGNVSSDIPAVSDGAERLARGICRDLFLADAERHIAALHAFADPELLGDEIALEAWWPPLPER